VENLGMSDFWRTKRVLVTGHTGFKGGWLCLWLTRLGADVAGLGLEPETGFFGELGLAERMDHAIGDIRDMRVVSTRMQEVQPDIVLHLAAQSLVLQSYRQPVDTWATNVMGSVHVLGALRALGGRRAAVMVTTDKVYRNREDRHAYCEDDRLGGHDPYSSSKAAMEIAVDSWRRSFLSNSDIRVASARAGNVIGGGDWAENRLLPDIVRALQVGQVIEVRNPGSVRPWQHVLEPLAGYLRLAEKLWTSDDHAIAGAYNFGPDDTGVKTVRDVVETALRHWPGEWRDTSDPDTPHEATLLTLSADKARRDLGVVPRWSFDQNVARTMAWYRDVHRGADASATTLKQIEEFGAP
jgi:CDP-glucose 4,6-dehydratase